ncbi:hypothetical protein BDQ17DRAFT_1527848 [Cyathus striatus]|nr:hypothetical protein BDQ17DRAFT_1527848 [Cyathus striatus]
MILTNAALFEVVLLASRRLKDSNKFNTTQASWQEETIRKLITLHEELRPGFLNKTKKPNRNPVEPRKDHNTPDSTRDIISSPKCPDAQIVAFGNMLVTGASISACDMYRSHSSTPDPISTSIHSSALICTRVPSTSTDVYGTSECILYSRNKLHLSNIPNFPRSPTPLNHPSEAYQIRNTGSKGLGMFAKRPLKTGDLILVERPLIVIPINTDLSGVNECPDDIRTLSKSVHGANATLLGLAQPMLVEIMARMSKENQDIYMALANAHSNLKDGTPTLSAIWKTNVFQFFGLPSFSFELRATKAIALGRRSSIAIAILAFLPKNVKPRSSHMALRALVSLAAQSLRIHATTLYVRPLQLEWTHYGLHNDSVSLVRDLEQEGMDGYGWYFQAMNARVGLCMCLSNLASASSSWDDERRWREEEMRYRDTVLRLILAHYGSSGKKNHSWVVNGY